MPLSPRLVPLPVLILPDDDEPVTLNFDKQKHKLCQKSAHIWVNIYTFQFTWKLLLHEILFSIMKILFNILKKLFNIFTKLLIKL